MPRLRVLSAALALSFALPAQAFDISAMTAEERNAFRMEIRNYLLENPEVLMDAISVLERRRQVEALEAERRIYAENYDAIFNDGYSYVGGNPDGDVTIVEFMDYRCGFCKRAFPAVEELIASDGNIRFIVKEFPILGEASVLGARYAIATHMVHGDEAYKTVHDAMMVMRGDLNDAALVRISEQAGLDHDSILNAMDDEEISRIINENHALAQKLMIQGTPSFVIGDQFVRGFLELDQMRAVVADIRERG